MSVTKVILKKDVYNLGEEGDIKEVKRGYAVNFLFPKGLAVDYSAKNQNILKRQQAVIEQRKLAKQENAAQLKAKLEEEKVVLKVPAGEKGRLYGTVTNAQIADFLNAKEEFNVDKKKVELNEHVKFAGSYPFRIHLYHDIYAEMEVTVEAISEDKEKKSR